MSEGDATSMRRRDLIALIGTAAGSAAMYRAMTSLSLAAESTYTGPIRLEGDPQGASVLILGAGLAGMVAAFELRNVIFGIYKNDARALYLDYIEPPFMMDPASIVVRKGAGFAFDEWSDLKGRKGVTNIGESYGDKFDAFMAKELTVAWAEGVDKAFAALLAQQADYMIIGLFPGREEARKLGLIDMIEFLPKELVSAAMYVAFSKQSKCGALRTGFSAGIRTAVDAGATRQLLEAVDKSLGQ